MDSAVLANNRKQNMTYTELIAKLVSAENATGLYLSDMCVDAENATDRNCEKSLFAAAVNAAGMRAEDAGYDINVLVGANIY